MIARIHDAFKLVHHQHTARRLAHHHTSYRALFLVLAVVGLSIATIQRTAAESYAVMATVPGDALTAPAIITSPASGSVSGTSMAIIDGTCQNVISGTLVTLTRDGTQLGSGVCEPDSTFSIIVTLVLGSNVIIPHVQTGLGDFGPDGQAVYISYEEPPVTEVTRPSSPGSPPMANVTSAGSSGSPVASTQGPSIEPRGDTILRQRTGHVVMIHFSIADGSNPYTLRTDWGDGQTETTRIDKVGEIITLTHTYTIPGMHTVSVEVVDANGRRAVLGFVVYARVVGLLDSPDGRTVAQPGAPSLAFPAGDWLTITRIVWMCYGLLSVGVIALWFASRNHRLSLLSYAHGQINRNDRDTQKKIVSSKKRHA